MDAQEYTGPIAVDRPLTEHEYELTKWILENGINEARDFLHQLDNARVCFLCGCGCASIDFSIDSAPRVYGPMKILGDFHFGSAEKRIFPRSLCSP